MILFIGNEDIISNYKNKLNSLQKNEFNKLFPKPGIYKLYLLIRDYGINPIIAEASACTPNILDGGMIVDYVVD